MGTRPTGTRFRIINRRVDHRADASSKGLARTSSEEEASVRNYFQMDECAEWEKEGDDVRNYFQMDECTEWEKEGDDGGSAKDDEHGNSDSEDDLAEHDDALDPNFATSTTQQRCDATAWEKDSEHADDVLRVHPHKVLS